MTTKAGDRIELVSTTDVYTRLQPGEKGTVRRIHSSLDEEVIEVDWDCGSRLSMIPTQGDRFKFAD